MPIYDPELARPRRGPRSIITRSVYHLGRGIWNYFKPRRGRPQTLWKRRARQGVSLAYGAGKLYNSFFSTKSMPPYGKRDRSGSRPPAKRSMRRLLDAPATPRATPKRGRTMARKTSSRRGSSSATRSRKRRSTRSNGRHNVLTALKSKVYTRRRKPLRRIVKTGIEHNHEYSGTMSSEYVRYIGHGTIASYSLKRAILHAMLKRLFIQMKLQVNDLNGPNLLTNLNLIVADDIIISYKRFPTDSPQVIAYTVGDPTTETVNDVIALFLGQMYDWDSSRFFMSMIFNPAAGSKFQYTELNLLNSAIEIDIKAMLKVQNATDNEGIDHEMTDVHRVPLVGRSYEAKGTMIDMLAGKLLNGQAESSPVVINATYGTVTFDGATVEPIANTPVPYYQMNSARLVGKVGIEPGEIFTSVLRNGYHMNLNKFWSMMASSETLGGARRFNLGRIRIFGIEKLLEKNQAAPTDITLFAEHEMNIKVALHTHANNLTRMESYQGNFV